MRRFFTGLLHGLEGLAVLLVLPGLIIVALLSGAGWQGVVRAGPRWRRFIARGLRDFRERWWRQARLESPWCLWRYFLLTECATLMERPPRRAEDRLLLLRLGHIGDLLHAVPAVREFKKQHPATVVDILVGPWSAALARKFDCFDEVLVWNPRVVQFNRGHREAARGFWGELSFLRRLANRAYRVVVSAAPLHFCELALLQAACPWEFWGVPPEFPLYPPPWETERVLPFDSRMCEADWVGACLAPAGLPSRPYALEYPLDEAARAGARRMLSGFDVPEGERYAVLAPGAGWPGKQWPAARFAEVGDWLASKKGWRILVAGSPGERALCEEVCGAMRAPAVNLGGRTGLDELAAILESGALFVGNDSGPMHIAAAVGAPTVTFWGPTFPEKWAPRGPRHLALRPAAPCAGCIYWHPRAVCTGTPPCIESVVSDLKELEKFLQKAAG
ncbi:MAG: glycosyltransferase family 9 protein [Verrucomicrobia bacterium]|nr:glycosyltransferase family 9 protein [Verrucomicrobiota bacterium]